jgi:hypothetical protein
MRRRGRKAGETSTPAAMPREIDERIERDRDYHTSSKHTYHSVRSNPHTLDWANRPSPFRVFANHPKLDLPRDLIAADAAALPVLAHGVAGLPVEHAHPPQDLRTLASWLHLASGITGERKVG